MARALLINPSYRACYGSTKASLAIPIYPTLGLATIAATLLEKGHEVAIDDLSYEFYDPNKIRERIRRFRPDIVGISGTTPLFNQARDISLIVKKISEKILVMAGGAHVSALPAESLMESKIDVAVKGEGDYTVCDIAGGLAFDKIPGIYYRNSNGTITGNAPRPMFENLNELPFPAWHLYDVPSYRDKVTRLLVRRSPVAMVEFSRGCIFKCDFCASKNTTGLGYRKKTPERVADELEYAYRLGFREFVQADDIFTSDNHWAVAVCEEIIRRKIKMAWTCQNGIRVESANPKLFSIMKKAGCYRVSFGFETGNDGVLQKFGKGGKATIEQGKEAVRLARRAGLDTSGCFLLGLSPDTEETMMDTIRYAGELELDMLKIGITIAFPGTAMFHAYRKKKLIRTYNWDHYEVYTDKELFAHEWLSFETIQKYLNLGYRMAISGNFRFIWRRFKRGVKTGEFFWDAYYFLKYLFLPSANSNDGNNAYAHSDEWPTVDYEQIEPAPVEWQQPTPRDWRSLTYSRRERLPNRLMVPVWNHQAKDGQERQILVGAKIVRVDDVGNDQGGHHGRHTQVQE